MDPIAWVIVVVIVVAAAAVVALALRQRQRAQLQERFGPEYDRTVERAGSRRDAEHELSSVASRRDKLDIRELDDAERASWQGRWDVVQARFVDAPAEAVGEAGQLVSSLMSEVGYPTDDFESRASLVAADHPHVVEHYREAQTAFDRHRRSGEGDTEDLRQSFVHYRQLFAVLVQPDERGPDPRETADQTYRSEADR